MRYGSGGPAGGTGSRPVVRRADAGPAHARTSDTPGYGDCGPRPARGQHPARTGEAPRPRAVRPRPLPHDRTPATEVPRGSASGPTASDSTARTGSARRLRATTLRIGSWSAKVVRGGQEAVDACRDAVQWAGPDLGTEDGYEMRTAVVVGHDFCGFQQFAMLPVGTVVTVETPGQVLRYKVYARYLTPGRGAPAHGLYWGDLTLQSCVGPDTGFTYLIRE